MKSRRKAYFAFPSASYGALVVVLLVVGVIVSASIEAQTLTIRLLNGKSGKPMSNKNVTLEWSPEYIPWEGSVVYFGKDGIGKVEVHIGAEFFTMMTGPKIGKEPYRIAFIDCNEPRMVNIQIAQVLKSGYVPRNGCSKKSAVPRPGEIVFWAMPNPWWLPDMQ